MTEDSGAQPQAPRPEEDDSDQAGATVSEQDALNRVQAMLHSGSELASDLMELLSTESRLAGRSLGVMLMLAVMMGLLLVSVWLFLMTAAGVWMITAEFLSPVAALLLVAAINAGLALLVWALFVRLSRNLTFEEFFGALRSLSRPPPDQINDNAERSS